MAWTLNKLPRSFLAGLSLLEFLMLSQWLNVTYGTDYSTRSSLVRSLLNPLLFFLPVLAIMLVASLIDGALRSKDTPRVPNRGAWFSLATSGGLALLLIGVLAYNIYWTSFWDQTTDGVGGIISAGIASITAIAAGMIMGVRSTGERRWAGGLFTVLFPLVFFGASMYGNSADYHAVTAQRARLIQVALERYKTKNGAYPQGLTELVPGELLAVPKPAIHPGEGWCYYAGPDFYQLSTYYRQYFSTPFSLHVYATVGKPPGADATCQNHLAELKRLYDPVSYPGP